MILYLKSHSRYPYTPSDYTGEDPAQRPPCYWCTQCGQEVYERDTELCTACKGAMEDESSLQKLYKGAKPQRL